MKPLMKLLGKLTNSVKNNSRTGSVTSLATEQNGWYWTEDNNGDLQLAPTEATKAMISADVELFQTLILQAVKGHYTTLLRKRLQLTLIDDYGIKDISAWEAEKERFVDRVCDPFVKNMFEYDPKIDDFGKYWEARCEIEGILDEKYSDIELENEFFSEQMSGVQFEEYVANILRSKGYTVTATIASGDQGCDLIANLDNHSIAIQCKRSAKPIGNKAIQEIVAGQKFSGADEAWVVSNAGFTRHAIELANVTGVKALSVFDMQLDSWPVR
jgi:restriction system protein